MQINQTVLLRSFFVLVGVVIAANTTRTISLAQPEKPGSATEQRSASADYSDFMHFSDKHKEEVVQHLFDEQKWGRPDQKAICQWILSTPGHSATFDFRTSGWWKVAAIDVVDKQNWADLAPPIRKLYQSPENLALWERSFRYLRQVDRKPVAAEILDDSATLKQSCAWNTKVSDEQLAGATDRLSRNPDKEAILVYGIVAASNHQGKGGSDRGNKAGLAVLKTLDQKNVLRAYATLMNTITFGASCDREDLERSAYALKLALPAQEYAWFARLSNADKENALFLLSYTDEWKRADQKLTCQWILSTPARSYAYDLHRFEDWQMKAIDLVQKQHWTEFTPLIRIISDSPETPKLGDRARKYIRQLKT